MSDLTAAVTIAAPPAAVWALVTDVERMAEWSPQVRRSFVAGRPVRLGTRFLNINRDGWKHWPTSAKVVRFSPHEDFAFRITENRTVWSFRLEPSADGGTVLTQARETPDGIAPISTALVNAVLGGQRHFTDCLRTGMAQTLQRIKAAAES
ncbi:SRPBCC family protein [Nocardioides sp. BP30]|uniref:SRPBCC family protein n=1 Tax=Nocardioides sp. BP30 TaxID=3036374 RepID=UPI0024693C04|nr:SRPBCC family protein [Nocardioides sp. BP30]WGL52536.1 SRPBCC family protein [Nocardioides sp. BP30]